MSMPAEAFAAVATWSAKVFAQVAGAGRQDVEDRPSVGDGRWVRRYCPGRRYADVAASSSSSRSTGTPSVQVWIPSTLVSS